MTTASTANPLQLDAIRVTVSTPFLERALPLLERGFSIIPLAPLSKEPCGVGAKDRTRDLSVIKSWSEQNPDGNVGVCADEDTVILDADDAAALRARIGKLDTYAVQSSPGKVHYYFCRVGLTMRNLELGPLGSLRAENQYVVSAGSIHPKTGEPYLVINDGPVAEMTAGLLRELEEIAAGAVREVERITVHWDGKEKIPSGSRQYFLRSQVGKLWDGKKTYDQLEAELLALNEKFCESHEEKIGKAKELCRWVMEKDPNDPPLAVILRGKALGTKAGEQVQVTEPEPKTAREMFKFTAAPGKKRDYTLLPKPDGGKFSGWFARGRIHLIGGSSGAGKTTLLVDALAKQAAGELFLGHPAGRLPFLVLFADRGRLSNEETLERMGYADANLTIDHMPVCMDESAWRTILRKIEEHMPAVCFIEGADTLVSDANKSQVVAPFRYELRSIAEHYHIAVILSVGSAKVNSSPKDGYSITRDKIFGSQIWPRMADDVLVLAYRKKADGRGGHVIAKNERVLDFTHRNAADEQFLLQFEDGRLVEMPPEPEPLEGVKETRSQDQDADLIAYLAALPAGTVVKVSKLTAFGSRKHCDSSPVPPFPPIDRVGREARELVGSQGPRVVH